MIWFKKNTPRQPSPHPIPPGVPSHVDTPLPNIERELSPASTVSEDVNDPGGSQTALQRENHGNDVTRGYPHDPLERDDIQETPSNVPDPKHFFPNSPSEREPKVLNRREHDAVIGRPMKIPLVVSSDHVAGDAPDPVHSDGSGFVEETSRDNDIGKLALSTDNAAGGSGSLIAILSAIYSRYKEVDPVGNKIQDLIERVTTLKKRFDSKPYDVMEQRSRDVVIRKLKVIEEQLGQLNTEPESRQPTGSCGDGDGVLLLLEDIREAASDYQMEREARRYDRDYEGINRDEAAVLNSVGCASRAEFRHGDRKGCLKGTRRTVLDKIELWTRDFSAPPVYWLNGLAGTGKTTIVQTIAERTFADGQLGASFFCSRDYQDRRDLHLIFPTIAVQLARKYADFRSRFVPLVQLDPGIAHESLYNQMRRLIIEPLKESKISTVIIIDALDECIDEEPASAILSVIGQFVSEIPKVKFLVTGRPEPRIQEGFRLQFLAEATDVFVLHEVELSQVGKDIRLFFKHRFSELVRRRPRLGGWPTNEQVDTLCERAAGLFVYAVATIKFVEKQSANPRTQLDLLLKSPGNSSREGGTTLNTGEATLDSLYTSILLGAFGTRDDPDNDPRARSVLGAMILAANPLSPSTIATLLNLDPDDVFPLLSSARSLLVLQEDIDCPVRPFHKSFPDFIADPDRCTNQRFHTFPPHHHSQLLMGCLDLMLQTLEKNMCKLPDGVANSDVGDMEERVEQYINPALQYACRSWHIHLFDEHKILVPVLDITSALRRFLETKFLFWLEVLSVLGTVRNAVDAMQAAVNWLKESSALHRLARDCSSFVSTYFDIICASSPHIYHSALALAPRTSIVRELYGSHARPFARVVYGLPDSWDSHAAATTHRFKIQRATWSPCNRFIAVSPFNPATVVDILDSVTLQKLQSLQFPGGEVDFRNLIFSPDSRVLTGCGYKGDMFTVSWDLQTGDIVGVTRWDIPKIIYKTKLHITYSQNGRMVAVLLRLPDQPISISICDIVSSKHTHNIDTAINAIPCGLWTHGESLWFAAMDQKAVGATGPRSTTVWKVGFTPGATITQVETFPAPEIFTSPSGPYMYFPQFSACSQPLPTPSLPLVIRDSRDDITVLEARTSKILLHQRVSKSWGITCSSGGSLFVCSIPGSGIYLWKDSPTGYVLLQKLPLPTRSPTPLLSPNGESIIVISDSVVRLWHTERFPISPSDSFIEARQTDNFILQFLPHRPLAAVSRYGDSTVTLLDLRSGDPQLTINTGVEVRGLGATENTVVVISEDRATTWKLPEGGFLPGTRMNVVDSSQTVDFDDRERNRLETGLISPDSRYILLSRMSSFPSLHSAATTKVLHWFDEYGQGYWFTLDNRNVAVIKSENRANLVEITTQSRLHTVGTIDIGQGQYGCPYTSSDYRVTEDGWILGSSNERLLILPPLWRSTTWQRMWNGQFLALLRDALSAAVILEFAKPTSLSGSIDG